MKTLSAPEPTAVPGVVTNLKSGQMGQYCFYDILNGKPSYKHKDIEYYIYWKQGFWNIGNDRNLKGFVSKLSSENEPPTSGWKNTVGAVNFLGFPQEGPGYPTKDIVCDLILSAMSECPLTPPTPTATPPGFTPGPTATPTITPTTTPTESPGPTATPPGPTLAPHDVSGYIVSGTPMLLRCCGSIG